MFLSCKKSRTLVKLNLSTCAASSINPKEMRKKYKFEEFFLCIRCHLLHATCHLSLTTTVTGTDTPHGKKSLGQSLKPSVEEGEEKEEEKMPVPPIINKI